MADVTHDISLQVGLVLTQDKLEEFKKDTVKKIAAAGPMAIGMEAYDHAEKKAQLADITKQFNVNKENLDLYSAELDYRKKMGMVNDDLLEHLKGIQEYILNIVNDTKKWTDLVPTMKTDLLNQLKIVEQLAEHYGEVEEKVESIGNKLRRWGLSNIARAYETLSTLDGLLSVFTNSVSELLRINSMWITQNYGIYGSVMDMTDAVTDAAVASGVLREEAIKTATALAQVAIAADSLKELTIVVADAVKELGIADETGAKFAKRMQTLGYTTQDTANQFKFLKQISSNFGVTGGQLDSMMGKLDKRFFMLQNRLGKSGMLEYQKNLAYLGGVAQKVGADFESMIGIIDELNEDRTKYIMLLQGTDWLNEKDSTKLFAAMVNNAGEAMSTISQYPAAFQEEIAKEMYGITLEQLNQMKKLKDEGIDLTNMSLKDLANTTRRMEDPMYAFTKALQDVASGLFTLLWPITKILEGMTWAISKLSVLPEWVKKTGASIFWIAIALNVLAAKLGLVHITMGGLVSIFNTLTLGIVPGMIGWLRKLAVSWGLVNTAQTTAAASSTAATTATSGGLARMGAAIGQFGKSIAPVILPILGLAVAFGIFALSISLLATVFTEWGTILKTLAAVGVALIAFAGMVLIATYIMGAAAPAAVPMLIVAAVFLVLAVAMWILAKAADVFVGALEKLIKLDFSGFAAQAYEFAMGMGYLIAGFSAAILAGTFALVAIVAFVVIGVALLIFFGILRVIGAMAPAALLAAMAIKAVSTALFNAFSVIGDIKNITAKIAMMIFASVGIAAVVFVLSFALGIAWFLLPLSIGFKIMMTNVVQGLTALDQAVLTKSLASVGLFAKVIASLAGALIIAAALIVPAAIAAVSFALIAVSMKLLGSIDPGIIVVLSALANYFAPAMAALATGINIITGAEYFQFAFAAASVAYGLGKLFDAVDSQGVSNLPIISNNFQRAMQEIRYGIDWLVGSKYDDFEDAAASIGDGLSDIFAALSNQQGLDGLYKTADAFDRLSKSLDHLSNMDLSNLSSNIEKNIAAMSSSVDAAKAAIADYQQLDNTNVIEHEKIISPGLADEINTNHQHNRDIISKLESLINTTSGVGKSVSGRPDLTGLLEGIAQMIAEYLPVLAEEKDTGLGSKTTSWTTRA